MLYQISTNRSRYWGMKIRALPSPIPFGCQCLAWNMWKPPAVAGRFDNLKIRTWLQSIAKIRPRVQVCSMFVERTCLFPSKNPIYIYMYKYIWYSNLKKCAWCILYMYIYILIVGLAMKFMYGNPQTTGTWQDSYSPFKWVSWINSWVNFWPHNCPIFEWEWIDMSFSGIF